MIIECPACHTRYRADGSLSITDSTLFECSREQCGHVFSYFPEHPRATEEEPVSEDSSMESTDTPFTEPFSASENDNAVPPQSLLHTATQPAVPPSLAKSPSSPKTPIRSPQETHSFAEDFSEPEEFSLEPPSLSDPLPSFSPSITTETVRKPEPVKRTTPPRQRSRPIPITTFSVWPALGLLVLLVLGYYFLGSRWRANITDTENLLTRLPIIGSAFVANQFSLQHIALSEVKSGFWLTKDSKRVFAISGKATNNASVPASLIQIEGQLHNIEGETVEQRVISCGMGTTADSLPTLTTREINVLQGLMPPKQFHVLPGQSVNFLIVFPNPPPAVTELSCRVATAQFGTS